MTIITKHSSKFHNAFPYFDRPVLIITQLARNQFSGKPHNYTLNNCNYNYSSKPDIEQTLIRKERKKKSPAQSTTVAVSSIKLQHFQWNKPKARHEGVEPIFANQLNLSRPAALCKGWVGFRFPRVIIGLKAGNLTNWCFWSINWYVFSFSTKVAHFHRKRI